MTPLLPNRRAVVTGGSRGLGRAIADRLAAEGAAVWVIDLPDAMDPAQPLAGRLAVDLADPGAEAALAAFAASIGPVDALVANAGLVPPWRGVAALDRAEWDRVMAVNVWGVAATLKAFAEPLAASGRGAAVLMASINGYRAHPDQILYTASKHAVVGLMRATALDLGRRGVRVNALAPGPVATDALMARIARRHAAGGPAPDEALAAMAADTALGRIATAAQVADAALFLLSDLSAGTTGGLLPVEAGLA
jgi:NAD(P)-dependent dehydrogenase (short-subunit alcohol dehydrogenase family)